MCPACLCRYGDVEWPYRITCSSCRSKYVMKVADNTPDGQLQFVLLHDPRREQVMNEQELQRKAKQIVECTLAYFMMEFPQLKKTIDKILVSKWVEAIDQRTEEVMDGLRQVLR